MPVSFVATDIAGFPRGGFERLEPYDGKLSRTVLRGACGRVTVLWAGNGPRLPGGLPVRREGTNDLGVP